jgi:hypothetical protein
MRRAALAAALRIAMALAPSVVAAQEAAAAQDAATAQGAAPFRDAAMTEGPSFSLEIAGLAYGLYIKSPRISAAASFPITERLSLQASPSAAWGGEEGSRLLELALPITARLELGRGSTRPYAAAGLELGWGLLPGGESAAAAGPILEVGARLGLFGSRFYLEPYAGGGLVAASLPDGSVLSPSLFGGMRLGIYCGPWPSSSRSP